MKRILLYSTLALGTGLFSCSQEDLMEQGSAPQAGRPVTISVQLPSEVESDAVSRALPAIPDGHQLRCILYVSGNGETPVRQETVLADAGGTISFTFTPATDTYTCSFWADFVSGTDTNADGRYDDLYYDTQRIPDVTYSSTLADGHSFYNNDACDAFTGHFTAAEVTGGTVVLKRPFAKVNFKEKTSEVSGNIAVTGYAVNNGMNITDGTVSETRANLPDYSGAVAGDGVWFCNYLFADGTSTRLPESISMTVGDGGATSISTDGLLLNANTQYNLSFEANVGEVVPAPQVGDYYYSDGSYSSALDENKTVVGVVFAATGDGSAIDSDLPANYEDVTFADGEIHGWVIGLKECASSAFSAERLNNVSGVAVANITASTTTCDEIKGYANSQAWKAGAGGVDLTALDAVDAYELEAPLTETSGWYIPALGQLLALREAYNAESSKVLEALTALNGDGEADLMDTSAESGNTHYYWSSTYHTNMTELGLMRFFPVSGETNYVARTQSATTGRHCRPILTF